MAATLTNPSIFVGGAARRQQPWLCAPPKPAACFSLQAWRCQRRRTVVVAAAAAGSGADGESTGRRILWSDVVVVKSKMNNMDEKRRRRWNSRDVGTAGVVVFMHLLCLLAPFNFTWGALWTALALYVITGLLGITLSFHRNLSHKSFRLPKWLEYTFAYCGVHALQGSPTDWVSTHRYHHQFCDSEKDPHSPTEGFWYSHLAWLFDTSAVARKVGGGGGRDNVADLEKQGFYRFIEKSYIMHPLALAAVLLWAGGVPYVVWGMGVRIVWVYHITWLVNSACHVWGRRRWATPDLSRNNWWVAALAFGEGWHNNHHAFEYSARHGLEWWEIDATWYVVYFLRAIGLATNVKLPSQAHRHSLALAVAVPDTTATTTATD